MSEGSARALARLGPRNNHGLGLQAERSSHASRALGPPRRCRVCVPAQPGPGL